MNILLLGHLGDKQSAIYVGNAFTELGHHTVGVSVREIIATYGTIEGQNKVLEEIDKQKIIPDIVLVLKGLTLQLSTLNKIKEKFPNAIFVNWFFDIHIQGIPIWENKSYFDTINFFDYYFCKLGGAVDRLKKLGFTNVHYLDEACSPKHNGNAYMNYYQSKNIGSDVGFCGSLGFFNTHPLRIKYLSKIIKSGYDLKVWGDVICDWKAIPKEIKEVHQQSIPINSMHSRVVQSTLINLGIDADSTLRMGHSARLYRVMCAGALYLSTPTNGVNTLFKVNKVDEPLTGDEELVFFYSEEDLISKLDFLLEHDYIRQKIAENGQKAVLANHKFTDRITEMLKIIGDKNENDS